MLLGHGHSLHEGDTAGRLDDGRRAYFGRCAVSRKQRQVVDRIDTIVIDAHDANAMLPFQKGLERLELVAVGGRIRREPGQLVLLPLAFCHLLGVAALVGGVAGAGCAAERAPPGGRDEGGGGLEGAPGEGGELGVFGQEDVPLGGL